MTRTVLVIDDVAIAAQMEPYLLRHGYAVEQIKTTEGAVDTVAQLQPDIILLDLHFEGDELRGRRTTGGGFHTVLREQFPHIPVLIFSTRLADNSIPDEEFEIQPLARIAKPDLIAGGWADTFAKRLDKAIAQHGRSADDYSLALGFPIGKTALMREFARKLAIVAPTDKNVVIRGEAGTGKELVARGIHRASGRKGQFVVARLAALPPGMATVTLFGQAREDASLPGVANAGRIAEAAGGTLYLDEIGDLPADAQAALSAYLAEQVDVRIVAATQFDLDGLVAAGLLRQDLKDRLAESDLYLPPLRQRLGDIPELFTQAVEEFNATAEIPVSSQLRPETSACLAGYAWPGNIREFRNVLNSALQLTNNEILLPEDISFESGTLDQPIVPSVDEIRDEAENEESDIDTALGLYQDLRKLEPGNIRYEAYKQIPIHYLVRVNELIHEHLCRLSEHEKGRKSVTQEQLAYFLLETPEGLDVKEVNRVRKYVSQNGGWPDVWSMRK